MATEELRADLVRLLAKNRTEYHIEYHGYLSNHMSHYLIALHKLGATSSRLEEAYEEYGKKLEPAIPPTSTVTTDNWTDLIGKKENYTGLIAFFDDQIKRFGVKTTLMRYVPELLEGLCGSAFHGLIQLGYALEIMDPANIAEGLAYWTFGFYSLGKPKPSGGEAKELAKLETKDVIGMLDRVRENPYFNDVFVTEDGSKLGFQKRLHRLAERHLKEIEQYDIDLKPYVARPGASVRRERIEKLIDFFTLSALKVFDSSGYKDFFALHLVTGFRSLKVTLRAMCQGHDDEVPDDVASVVGDALNFFWRAVVCSYIAIDRPEVSDIGPDAIKEEERVGADENGKAIVHGWEDLIKEVIPSDDEHLVKLVFVCWQEAQEHRDRPDTEAWQSYCLHSAINTVLRFQGTDKWRY